MNPKEQKKVQLEKNKIHQGECLKLMKDIPDHSIDMILCDLPYGVSRNKWDSVIDLKKLWKHYKRIIKDNGAIVLTAVQPFASQLVMSNQEMYKYDWIWKKTISSGQLNVNIQPLRNHENVLVFYRKHPTYNQQFTNGKPYKIDRKVTFEGPGYNKQTNTKKDNNGYRHPTSVLEIPNPRIKNGHPTQKPLKLFEYLIKTYTNEKEVVLDNSIGSGTTAIAALKTNREFIGIEISEKYVNMAKARINQYHREVRESGGDHQQRIG